MINKTEIRTSAKSQVSIIVRKCINSSNMSYREMAKAMNEVLYDWGAEISHASIGYWKDGSVLPKITTFQILVHSKDLYDDRELDWRYLLGRDILPILKSSRARKEAANGNQ